MAQTEDFVTRNMERRAGSGRSSKEIRSEIDRTREDMDETFAALDAKLTPSQIGQEIWHLFKGGSSAGASKVWRIAREHPMPAAVIGLGLGWLLVESSKSDGRIADSGTYRASYVEDADGFGEIEEDGPLSKAREKVKNVAASAKNKVGDATEWTREHAHDLGHQAKGQARALKGKAKSQARRAQTGLWQTLEDNPLMVGAATLAVGVIAGLLIPETERENELMGETRDRLIEEVKDAGQQTLEKGKHVAEAVAGSVKEEVKNVAKEAVNTAKQELKNQNLTSSAQPAIHEELELAKT